jgi:hypothetical protein
MPAEERSTREVLVDHLRRVMRGDLEGDLEANYAPSALLIEPSGVYFGHAGFRRAAEQSRAVLQDARYEFVVRVAVGDVGYVLWRAVAGDLRVDDGADTFVVAEGLIVAHTSYYVVVG